MVRRSLLVGLLLAVGCGSSGSTAPECVVAADCTGVDDACRHRTCTQGSCGAAFTADGTAVPVQVPGDCRVVVCDGLGATRSAVDDGDAASDGNPCTTDACSAGVPSHTPVAAGLACGTGQVCDGAGLCVGCNVAADCPGADTACQARTCTAHACGLVNQVNGAACDDGDPATVGDACLAGVCAGTRRCAGVICTPLDACHQAGTCDPATGACSNPSRSDGTACDDGNACTQGDTCQAGTCVTGSPVTCAPLDQCHQAGTCDAGTGTCSNPSRPNGTACDDGNPSTTGDVCTAGICAGTGSGLCAGVTCTALDACHQAGTCNPATGACSNPARADGTACDDGSACTQGDFCQAGTCTGGAPLTCVALDQCHQVGTCNPGTGSCANPSKADGTACDDGNPSTSGDACVSGVCVGTP